MRRTAAVALGLFALLSARAAFAWPVDVYVDVQAGKLEFRKLGALSWVESRDPEIATAEVLPSGELLITGKKPGRTLLLLYAQGTFAVWRVRVAPEGEQPKPVSSAEALDAAKRQCPGLRVEDGELAATVPDERCRQALLQVLQGDDFNARQLKITFQLPALQAQLKDLQDALKQAIGQDLKPRYVGAGLVLEGDVTPGAHRKALWTLFLHSVGRVPLEDRMHVAEVSPHPDPLPARGEGEQP